MRLLKKDNIDTTKGAIIPQIFSLVIPLILMTLVQKLFNAMDIAVLGRMADTSAVASVGATTTVIHLVVDCFVGLSAGAKIVFSRLVGKNDTGGMQRTLDTSVVLSSGIGLLVAVAGILLSPYLLDVIKCPEDCFEDAVIYMQIYFFVAPAILLYNLGAALLTSWGDSRRPLYYAIVSGVLNVVLNVILCCILPQKVAAVAIATAASQVLSALLVIKRLCCVEGEVRLRIHRIKVNLFSMGQIIRFGIPLALTSLIYPLANLQISSAINSYGVACVAGNSASQTVEEMLGSCRLGFGTATATFVGQNLGAQKPDRVKKSFFHLMWTGVCITFFLGMILALTSSLWLPLFLKNDALALEFATSRLRIMLICQFISTANTILANTVQAFGYPIFGTLNTVVWVLGFRTLWMEYIYPKFPTYTNLILCFIIAWICTVIFYILIFSVIYRRYRKGKLVKI